MLGDHLLDRKPISRRLRVQVAENLALWVTAPEDVILRKLTWFEPHGNESQRQWRDVLGVLATRREVIDLDDLSSVAAELGLAELLSEALRQSVD